MPAVNVHGVSLRKGPLQVLTDVSFSVDPGEVVAIMAPSGAGKSTLLRVVLGLLLPDAGTVSRQVPSVAIGVVFQEENLLPWLTVQENVRTPTLADAAPNHSQTLSVLGLTGFENYFPRQLSTGMKQKVAFARAFCREPQLFCIDEGLSALDEEARAAIGDRLRLAARRRGAAVILVSHVLSDVLHIADRVVLGTSCPFRVKKVVANPLPFERDASIRFTSAFRDARQQLEHERAD